VNPELADLVAQLSLDGPVEPFLVLADWLQRRGDPWGELIAMQCASPELHEERADTLWTEQERLLREHGRTWCPLYGRAGRVVRWSRGFVQYVGFLEDLSRQALGRELQQIFAVPQGALIRELALRDLHLDSVHLPALMLVRPRLAQLAVLDLEGNWFTPSVVRELAGAFPGARLGNQRGAPDGDDPPGMFVRSWRDD
jgi:hypothetical protein